MHSREVAKERSREALITAAMQLFGKHGLDGPSLDDICKRAGYTRGVFYVHFKTREELIVAVMERTRARLLESFLSGRDLEATVRGFADAVVSGAYPPPSGVVKLHNFLDACMRLPLLRKRHLALLDDTMARLALTVHAAQSAGKARRDVTPEAAALLLLTLVTGVDTLVDLGFKFDVRGGAAAMLKVLRG
jgi:TetR/AcrR family transcriptional repressor of nem operon